MKLGEYLKKNSIKRVSFAKSLGVPYNTLYRWISGKSMPAATAIMLIGIMTNFEVTSEDFIKDGK